MMNPTHLSKKHSGEEEHLNYSNVYTQDARYLQNNFSDLMNHQFLNETDELVHQDYLNHQHPGFAPPPPNSSTLEALSKTSFDQQFSTFLESNHLITEDPVMNLDWDLTSSPEQTELLYSLMSSPENQPPGNHPPTTFPSKDLSLLSNNGFIQTSTPASSLPYSQDPYLLPQQDFQPPHLYDFSNQSISPPSLTDRQEKPVCQSERKDFIVIPQELEDPISFSNKRRPNDDLVNKKEDKKSSKRKYSRKKSKVEEINGLDQSQTSSISPGNNMQLPTPSGDSPWIPSALNSNNQMPSPNSVVNNANMGKLPISRLKSQPNNTQPPIVNQHQRKIAHNAIERKYRNNINDRINDLKNAVPALCHAKPKDSLDSDEEPEEIDGIPAATKLNKATILRKATEYIYHLKSHNTQLKSENDILKNWISTLPNGQQILSQVQQQSELKQRDQINHNFGSPPISPISSTTSDSSSSQTQSADQSFDESSNFNSRILMASLMSFSFFGLPDLNPFSSSASSASTCHSERAFFTLPIYQNVDNSSYLLPYFWTMIRSLIFIGCLITLFFNERKSFKLKNLPLKYSITPKTSPLCQSYIELCQTLHQTLHDLPLTNLSIYFSVFKEIVYFLSPNFTSIKSLLNLPTKPSVHPMTQLSVWLRLAELHLYQGDLPATTSFQFFTLFKTYLLILKHSPPSLSRIYAITALQLKKSLPESQFSSSLVNYFWKKATYTQPTQITKWLRIHPDISQSLVQSHLWKDFLNTSKPPQQLCPPILFSTPNSPLDVLRDLFSFTNVADLLRSYLANPDDVDLLESFPQALHLSSLPQWYLSIALILAKAQTKTIDKEDLDNLSKLTDQLNQPIQDMNNQPFYLQHLAFRQTLVLSLLSLNFTRRGEIEKGYALLRERNDAYKLYRKLFKQFIESNHQSQNFPSSLIQIQEEIEIHLEFLASNLILESLLRCYFSLKSLETQKSIDIDFPIQLSSKKLRANLLKHLIYLRRISPNIGNDFVASKYISFYQGIGNLISTSKFSAL